METLEARFTAAFMDRLADLENRAVKQSDQIDALKRQLRAPVLAASNITFQQMTFADDTALHWALGGPASMYVANLSPSLRHTATPSSREAR